MMRRDHQRARSRHPKPGWLRHWWRHPNGRGDQVWVLSCLCCTNCFGPSMSYSSSYHLQQWARRKRERVGERERERGYHATGQQPEAREEKEREGETERERGRERGRERDREGGGRERIRERQRQSALTQLLCCATQPREQWRSPPELTGAGRWRQHGNLHQLWNLGWGGVRHPDRHSWSNRAAARAVWQGCATLPQAPGIQQAVIKSSKRQRPPFPPLSCYNNWNSPIVM